MYLSSYWLLIAPSSSRARTNIGLHEIRWQVIIHGGQNIDWTYFSKRNFAAGSSLLPFFFSSFFLRQLVAGKLEKWLIAARWGDKLGEVSDIINNNGS